MQKSVKHLVTLAMFTTMALVIFVVEAQIPVPVPIPGIKLGLANIITLFVLQKYRVRDALAVLVLRVIIYWDTGQLLVFIERRLIVSGWNGIAVSIVTESVFVVCQRLRCDSAQHRANFCSHVGDADHAGNLVLAILID